MMVVVVMVVVVALVLPGRLLGTVLPPDTAAPGAAGQGAHCGHCPLPAVVALPWRTLILLGSEVQ